MKYLIFIMGIFFIISCKKPQGVNQGLNNNNTQTYDLMSTKSGSWWLYKATNGSVFYRYATGKDSIKENLTFNFYYRYDTTSALKTQYPDYFGKNSNKYITLIDIDGTQTTYLTYVILEDGWYNGQNWDNTETKTLQGINADIWIHSNVVNVNDTLTYNNKTYDSVIYVHSDINVRPSGLANIPPYTNCGTLDVWFKRGVGIIREKGAINIAGIISNNYEDWLMDYYLVP
jgi:hypothetical protein